MTAKLIFDDCYQPEPNSGCWLWLGFTNHDGYGRLGVAWGRKLTHVISWERKYGPKPEGLELDHKCRVRCCVNPDHLELVTHAENVRRGMAATLKKQKTHCPNGHPWDAENTIVLRGKRECHQCRNAAWRRWYHKRKGK